MGQDQKLVGEVSLILHLFEKSTVSSQGPASLPAEDISTNGPRQDSLFDDDPEDLFAGKLPFSFSRWRFAGL